MTVFSPSVNVYFPFFEIILDKRLEVATTVVITKREEIVITARQEDPVIAKDYT